MKKILGYALVAVLLGVVTMLSPFSLFVNEIDISEVDTQDEQFNSPTPENMRTLSTETEQTRGITSIAFFPDILFIAFMLTLSLVIALGVMRHFRRKTLI